MSSSSSSSSVLLSTSMIVHEWQPSHQRRRSLPELLAVRQASGKPTPSRAGPLSRRGVPIDLLSSRSAWNPRRLQNMIMAVGPGTPASLLLGPESNPSMSSSASSFFDVDDDDDEDDDDIEDESSQSAEERSETGTENEERTGNTENNLDQEEGNRRSRRSVWRRRESQDEEMDDNDVDGEEEENDDAVESHDNDARYGGEPRGLAILQDGETSQQRFHDESEEQAAVVGESFASRSMPTMRHGGCINTAAWMDCGWKISFPNGIRNHDDKDAIMTQECPTQLVTSGDDLLVKFWDVSQAMGMISPLGGSSATICPFSSSVPKSSGNLIRKWQRYYDENTNSDAIAGTVLPLATIFTGHTNNVFHVTPLHGQPGKVATCGADGFLRLGDLESGRSRVILTPERCPFGIRTTMCFSHYFLSQNTGLLCNEKGLRRFDLRVSPREQVSTSLLVGSSGCKACAIWSSSNPTTSLEEGESAYVFAGGFSSEVALWDLRMTDASSNKIVQKYSPKNLSEENKVSVSGIDVSKDGQELLVSYECDQVYTFPIFPASSSSSGSRPTMDEIRQRSKGPTRVFSELACYGAHLNERTFLKNAKYAGPRDEYICTGSDSGHAWIYERKNGSVVSHLMADHSTCNGVIPHPSLPFFITYGIDSTAKLWRATTPVDSDVDDTATGRWCNYRKATYEMSAPTKNWHRVLHILREYHSNCNTSSMDGCVFADQIPAFGPSDMFSQLRRTPRGNDLQNLPRTLFTNYYDSITKTLVETSSIENGMRALHHRVSLIRLRHQADRLGLPWNKSVPWRFDVPPTESTKTHDKIHPADLIPDYPSDWIPYDPELIDTPWGFDEYFNVKEYGDFYTERYSSVELDDPYPTVLFSGASSECETSVTAEEQSTDDVGESNSGRAEPLSDPDRLHNTMVKTLKVLKDGGNLAMQEEELDLAAIRYDKALRYGAVASLLVPSKGASSPHGNFRLISEDDDFAFLVWNELVQLVIRIRLNLVLLFLKPHFAMPQHALTQAKHALHDLDPFCNQKGKIKKGKQLNTVHVESEPEATFVEAKALQAKAFFRLGSAQCELREFTQAIRAFEGSIMAAEEAKAKPDKLVLRRLAEAKRESRNARKRERTKFESGFSAVVSPDKPNGGRD